MEDFIIIENEFGKFKIAPHNKEKLSCVLLRYDYKKDDYVRLCYVTSQALYRCIHNVYNGMVKSDVVDQVNDDIIRTLNKTIRPHKLDEWEKETEAREAERENNAEDDETELDTNIENSSVDLDPITNKCSVIISKVHNGYGTGIKRVVNCDCEEDAFAYINNLLDAWGILDCNISVDNDKWYVKFYFDMEVNYIIELRKQNTVI